MKKFYKNADSIKKGNIRLMGILMKEKEREKGAEEVIEKK